MSSRTLPQLADRFLYTKRRPIVTDRVMDAVKDKIRRARKIVLDEAAVVRVAEVIRDIPDLLVREAQFARAPFETMFVEFKFDRFYETVAGQSTDENGDAYVGYLIDHDTAYVISGGTAEDPGSHPALLPVAYHLHQPWEMQDQLDFCHEVGTSRAQLDGMLWGESVSTSAIWIAGRFGRHTHAPFYRTQFPQAWCTRSWITRPGTCATSWPSCCCSTGRR